MSATWFTVRRMKNFAIVLSVLEGILLAIWLAGSIYIISNFEQLCFETQFGMHFDILVHFALAAYILTVLGDITKEQRRYRKRYGKEIEVLPYQFYYPALWISISIISLVASVVLMAAGIRLYLLREGTDECQDSRLAHIIFDVVATLLCLISIVWFIIYTIYTIKQK